MEHFTHPTLEFQRISSFEPFGTIPCPFGRKCSMSASTMCSRTMYLAYACTIGAMLYQRHICTSAALWIATQRREGKGPRTATKYELRIHVGGLKNKSRQPQGERNGMLHSRPFGRSRGHETQNLRIL